MYLRVDGERRLVDGAVAHDDPTVVADEYQVRDLDLGEGDAQRIHPEVVGELRVAGGDVTGHALVEAELAEYPEGRGQPLLAMQALVVGIGEGGVLGDGQVLDSDRIGG